MKKILFYLILFAACAYVPQSANAQSCNVVNLVCNIKSFTPSPGGGCTYVADIGFDIEHNGGNKYIYAHLWLGANYPAWAGTYASAPTAADLNASNAIGTIQIDVGTPDVISLTYKPGGTPVMLSGTLTKTTVGMYDRYLISGVTLSFASCPPQFNIKGDVWASQSGVGKVVHCLNGGLIFVPLPSDFNLFGQLFCSHLDGSSGREYNVQMTSTNSMANALTVSYDLYVDNGNGTFSAPTETFVSTFPGISVYSGNSYNGGRVNYSPYSENSPFLNNDLWVLANISGLNGTFTQLLHLTNSCIPLPVKFSAFTAKRTNSSTVNLVWQTSSEYNSTGFEVQRNSKGNWETINFTPTQAPGGTSDYLLTYMFSDINNAKGISQYRIRQVDMAGRTQYSSIRAVRSDDVSAKTIIYPNPGINGRVNVAFEDAAASRDIVLMDISGRIIRQWNGIINNNMVIENLNPGLYSLRITVRETGIQTVDKFVINRR